MAEINEGQRSVGELTADLGDTAKELYQRLDIARQIHEHPYRTLAVAAGVGYVLGGGLFTPLTGALVRIGARAALLPMVQSTVENLAGLEDETPKYF